MSGTSFGNILIYSKIPPPVLMFPLIRFMSIVAPTWPTTIRPTMTSYVSKHHKCPTQRRIDSIFDKRSLIIVLFHNPLFTFLFYCHCHCRRRRLCFHTATATPLLTVFVTVDAIVVVIVVIVPLPSAAATCQPPWS
jgi:hypothetical protein